MKWYIRMYVQYSTQQEEATVSLERKHVTQLPMYVCVREIHSSIPVFLLGVTSILLHQVVKELSPSVPGSTLEAVEATSLHAQASYMMKHQSHSQAPHEHTNNMQNAIDT